MNFQTARADKYRSREVEIDGIIFDSKKEGNIYLELKACLERGEIERFERQKRYELIPAQWTEAMIPGKKKPQRRCVERAITYVADFVVYYPDGEVVVLDPKGFKTDVYRIKKKLLLMVHKIKIKEI
jgi:hypothetical protein